MWGFYLFYKNIGTFSIGFFSDNGKPIFWPGGLVKKIGDNWIVYNKQNSGIASNTVNCIEIDSSNHKWIGHPFSGLSIYREGGVLLTALENAAGLTFRLLQNFPNPFNNSTTISFSLGKASHIELNVYNALGQLVKILFDEEYQPGNYQVMWNDKDNSNRPLPSGVYVYTLRMGGGIISKKMLLLR